MPIVKTRWRPKSATSNILFAIFGAGSFLLTTFLPCHAENCSLGYRELAGVQNMPKVREHICPTMTGDLSRNLRVTFVRLDEVLTGNLVREQTPEIEQLFGGAKLIDNEVSAELRALFHDFAHKTVMPATNIKFTVKVKALRADEMSHAVSVELPSITANENEVRRFWSISSKTVNVPQPNEYGIQYPKLSEGFFSKTNTRWPDGFKQFYVCQNDAILCTELWRYISRLSELDVL
jgi:hypothetical protein